MEWREETGDVGTDNQEAASCSAASGGEFIVLLVGMYGTVTKFPAAFMYDPATDMVLRTCNVAEVFYQENLECWEDQSVLGGILFTDDQGKRQVWNPYTSEHRQIPSTSPGDNLLGVSAGAGDEAELMVGTQNLQAHGVKWNGAWYWLTLGINGVGGSDLLRYDAQQHTSEFVLPTRPASWLSGELQDSTTSSPSLHIAAGRLHCLTLRQDDPAAVHSPCSNAASTGTFGNSGVVNRQVLEIWRLNGDAPHELRWIVAATMPSMMFKDMYTPGGLRGKPLRLYRIGATYMAIGDTVYVYSRFGRGAACDLSQHPPAWRRLPSCPAPFELRCCFRLRRQSSQTC